MKIAILYVGIGRYYSFFDGFYKSCKKYFLPNIPKTFFLYSDNANPDLQDVIYTFQEDLGWPGNTLFRFKMFLTNIDDLKKFDYIFFFNGNTLFLEEINESEFLPSERENYLVALSWNVYKKTPINKLDYDRNPLSEAYIPYGTGKKYYQGGLHGGRSKEYIELIIACDNAINMDDKKGIVAKNHDESQINKYFLDKNIKVLDDIYGRPEEWETPVDAKIIFRDKNKVLSKDFIESLKDVHHLNIIERVYCKLLSIFNF